MANEYKDRAEPSFLLPIILSGFIFLITISRIIIGVHDLQDIIGGLLIGIGFLIAYLYLEPVASKKIEPLNISKKIILASIVSIILLITTLILFPDEDLAMMEGVLLGLCIGFVLEDEYVKYDTTVLNEKQKFINLVLGLVILLIPFVVFELLFEGTLLLIFIEFSLLSFIMAFVIPLIFTKINRI